MARSNPEPCFGRAAGEYGRTQSGGLSGLWARLSKRLADNQLYRQTLDELDALSDRDLADLGLSRMQIREVAHESVYGA